MSDASLRGASGKSAKSPSPSAATKHDFRERQPLNRLPHATSTLLALGTGALLGLLGAAGIKHARARNLHVLRTMFGPAFVFDAKESDLGGTGDSPVRVLRVGGVFQSATYLDERRFSPVFAYYRAFDLAFRTPAAEDARASGTVLMLGGGGYAWPKHVLSVYPDVAIDVVEIDPAITAIARKHFFLDEAIERFDGAGRHRLDLICADGRAYLEQCPKRYDAIVNDTFSGAEPVASLTTVEAAQAAKRRLAEGGRYLANVVSRNDGSELAFLQSVVATLSSVFEHVYVIPCSDESFGGEDNYLVVASDDACHYPEAIPFDEGFLGRILCD